MNWIWNPKAYESGMITCIPQSSLCPNNCPDCFFQSGRSYLEPLEENLPHIPPLEMTKGRIVRVNDGHDSNVERGLVEQVAQQFDAYFFNTSIPLKLEEFSGPVILTANPGLMTDTEFHVLPVIPPNLMFVRARVNWWNREVVEGIVDYYTRGQCPVVLTFMAYYETPIPEQFKQYYEWRIRTKNHYYCLKSGARSFLELLYADNPLVYSCGYKGTHSCSQCGNCIREYYNAKERMRSEKGEA